MAVSSSISPRRDPVPLERRLAPRVRPERPAVMLQSWRELLFLHWRFDPAVIQATLPSGLTVDTFDGDAWVGVVPFFMRNVRPPWCPNIPGASHFLELNLRTYAVDDTGTPGVWFYSLDANQRLAVHAARRFFHLPYEHARMRAGWDRETGAVEYRSQRRGVDSDLACEFAWTPSGTAGAAEPRTLEFFLIERYILFATDRQGAVRHGQVHHPPYDIQPADVAKCDANLFVLNGLPRPEREPEHVCVSRGVDVEIFRLRKPSG